MSITKEVYLTNQEAQLIFGIQDANISYMEHLLNVQLYTRGNLVKIRGEVEFVERASEVFEALKKYIRGRKTLSKNEILRIVGDIPGSEIELSDQEDVIVVDSKRRFIEPRNPKQKEYLSSIRDYDLTFGIGPAGTGKTYLAVACGIEFIKKGIFQKVILTRPALEAGERLGFLPGDLEEKIKPYLQPIYDALYDILR